MSRGFGRTERYVLEQFELPIEHRRMKIAAIFFALVAQFGEHPEVEDIAGARAMAGLLSDLHAREASGGGTAIALLTLADGYAGHAGRPLTRHLVEKVRRSVKLLERAGHVQTFQHGPRRRLYVAAAGAQARYLVPPSASTPPRGVARP
jgi:hypothetical protein